MRAAFRKGLAGVSLIAEKNKADVEKVYEAQAKTEDKVDSMRDDLSRLQERVPKDLKERLARLEGGHDSVKEIVKDDTARVRTLQLGEAGGIKTDKRESAKWGGAATVGAAIIAMIASIVAAYIAAKG
jgi:hypothetical protein